MTSKRLHHSRLEGANLLSFSLDSSSAWCMKGSQPENSVSTRLGSSVSAFEPSSETCLPSDLQLFSNLLDGHLVTALNELAERDVDVARLVSAALMHKTSLLEEVFRVFETLKTVGKQVPVFALGLRAAAQAKDTSIALNIVALIQAAAASVKKCLFGMRTSYVALLEQVHYMVDCIDVETDYVHTCAGVGFVTSDDGLDMPEKIQSFAIGLGSVREAEDVMGGCFDSWLHLHTIELSVRDLEKRTQQMCQDVSEASEPENVALACGTLFSALEQLDQQCTLVLQS